jgi:hypothetical protein
MVPWECGVDIDTWLVSKCKTLYTSMCLQMHVYLGPVSRTYYGRTLDRPVRHRMTPRTFSKPSQRLIPLDYLHSSIPGGLSLAVILASVKLTIPTCAAFSFDLVPPKMLKQTTVYERYEFRSSSLCTFLQLHVTFFVLLVLPNTTSTNIQPKPVLFPVW